MPEKHRDRNRHPVRRDVGTAYNALVAGYDTSKFTEPFDGAFILALDAAQSVLESNKNKKVTREINLSFQELGWLKWTLLAGSINLPEEIKYPKKRNPEKQERRQSRLKEKIDYLTVGVDRSIHFSPSHFGLAVLSEYIYDPHDIPNDFIAHFLSNDPSSNIQKFNPEELLSPNIGEVFKGEFERHPRLKNLFQIYSGRFDRSTLID